MTSTAPIGYLVPEFPAQTHAFFWRELQAIETFGVPVTLFSTRRPPKNSCPHSFAETAQNRTTYLFPFSPKKVSSFLATRPKQVVRAVAYVASLRETPLRTRATFLALIGSAAELAADCRRQGIRHVHIHSCANAAHLGALAHILDGLSYSLTLHGDLPVYGTDHKAKMAQAVFVSAVTAPLQRSLQEDIGGARPYPVIWMGVDTDRFQPDATKRASRLADRLEVVSIARLNHMKGHVFFLRAMAALRCEGIDIFYRIAGDGPERDTIVAEIDKLGLKDHVSLLGSVDEEVVRDLLQSSDALALTSINKGEAAPVAVMEAMSCGVPPICSIIGGTPDMIVNGVDGFLVPQRDVSAITEATRQLASDAELRARMGVSARRSAQKKFDHHQNAIKLYNEIQRATAG